MCRNRLSSRSRRVEYTIRTLFSPRDRVCRDSYNAAMESGRSERMCVWFFVSASNVENNYCFKRQVTLPVFVPCREIGILETPTDIMKEKVFPRMIHHTSTSAGTEEKRCSQHECIYHAPAAYLFLCHTYCSTSQYEKGWLVAATGFNVKAAFCIGCSPRCIPVVNMEYV